MSKKRIWSLIFCLVLGMIFHGCCYAEEDPTEPIQLFAEKKVSRTISTPGENLVPMEFGEIPVHHVNMKANNEKLALFYLDYDGLHVIPIAKGKFNITFTNEDSKKDKTVLELVVEETSLDSSEDMKAYAVFENCFIHRYKKDLTVKYYISGGKKPYQCVISIEDYHDGSGGGMWDNEFKAKNNYGKYEFYAMGGLIRANLKVMDADGNTCQVETNPVVAIEDYKMSIYPEFDLKMMRVNEQTEIPYIISGGSGTYEITESWQLKSPDGFTVQEEKKKYTSDGNISVAILPSQTGELTVEMDVKDKKSKNKAFYQMRVKVTDKGYLHIKTEKRIVHIGEVAKVSILAKDIKVENAIIQKRYARGETLPSDRTISKLKVIDDTHYELSFVPTERGFLIFDILQDGDEPFSSDMISVIP